MLEHFVNITIIKKDIIKDNADQEDNNCYSKLAERQDKSYALC